LSAVAEVEADPVVEATAFDSELALENGTDKRVFDVVAWKGVVASLLVAVGRALDPTTAVSEDAAEEVTRACVEETTGAVEEAS